MRPTVQMIKAGISREAPSILTGIAFAGVPVSLYFAIKETPIASKAIQKEQALRYDDWLERYKQNPSIGEFDEELKWWEYIKYTWKIYLPMVLSGVITLVCIVGSNRILIGRNTALLSLYTLTEAAMREYQAKVIEQLGEKKEEKIRDAIAQDRLDKNPIQGQDIILTGKGDHLFYDTYSGRYFKSDIEKVRKLQNDFNAELINEMYKSINDFYDLLGLEPVIAGNNKGWDVNHGMLDIKYSAKIATDGEPCIVMDYWVQPKNL